MPKKPDREKDLPSVSKQTAGGVAGAVIGGIVGVADRLFKFFGLRVTRRLERRRRQADTICHYGHGRMM